MSILDALNPYAWVGKILTGIGGQVVQTVIGYHKDSLDAANTHERIDADLASRELAVQTREKELDAQYRIATIGHYYEPEKIAEYVVVAYLAKCVVWDTMLGWGSTLPIHGAVAVWMGLIFSFMFAKRGIENVAKIMARK